MLNGRCRNLESSGCCNSPMSSTNGWSFFVTGRSLHSNEGRGWWCFDGTKVSALARLRRTQVAGGGIRGVGWRWPRSITVPPFRVAGDGIMRCWLEDGVHPATRQRP